MLICNHRFSDKNLKTTKDSYHTINFRINKSILIGVLHPHLVHTPLPKDLVAHKTRNLDYTYARNLHIKLFFLTKIQAYSDANMRFLPLQARKVVS